MKIALTMIMLFGSIFAAAEGYRAYTTVKQTVDNKARYEQQKKDRDVAMTKACAAGKTGVVLYWKGVNCAKNG